MSPPVPKSGKTLKREKQSEIGNYKNDHEVIEKATHLLLPFVMPNRWKQIQSVLQQRTQNALFCLKILPILPMSGHVHEYHWVVQEFDMSMSSSAKWLTVRNDLTSSHALEAAVREKYNTVRTGVNPDSKDSREVNWKASGKKFVGRHGQ